jgi:UDP-glucose 4-epimerase
MNCYVTGAAGFIGSHLVDRLLALGHHVVGVDNFVLGKKTNLAQPFKNPNFVFEELDVNSVEPALAFVKKQRPIDTIWHMAANSDIQAGSREPDIDLRLTFLTTFNTIKVAEALKIQQIVFASSSAIYGDYPGELREDAGPLFPISNYGAMKLASEGVLSAAVERFLKRLWVFRFPNVVGGRATHGAIYDFIQKLGRNPKELEVLGDGSQEKPYLHVSELIDAMLHLFQKAQQPINYYNIAPTGPGTTVRFIAEATILAMSPKAKIRYTGGSKGWVGDVPKFTYSIDKLKTTGWSPKLSSNAAVELAIRENLECAN